MPTAEAWRRTTAERAIRAYHWAFLAQPYPLPETLIGKDPVFYVEHTLKSWAKSAHLSHFSAEALAHYRALLQDPARVHAVCEDYRAGATIDWRHDEADMAAGRKIACPTFLLWGSDYLGRGGAKPLEVWRAWCSSELSGAEIDSGHFLAEENPKDTLAALLPFLAAQRAHDCADDGARAFAGVPSPSWGRDREGGLADIRRRGLPPPLAPPPRGRGIRAALP